jgi:hypothetical protein
VDTSEGEPGVSNKDRIAHDSWEALSQADPLVTAVAAATIATALGLARGLPRVLAERNWVRRRNGLAAAHGAISRALRADLRSHLSPEELATLEAARAHLVRLT